MVKRYGNVALPEDLLEQIDDVLENTKFGYKTRAEFVKESVRFSLKELISLKIKKQYCER